MFVRCFDFRVLEVEGENGDGVVRSSYWVMILGSWRWKMRMERRWL